MRARSHLNEPADQWISDPGVDDFNRAALTAGTTLSPTAGDAAPKREHDMDAWPSAPEGRRARSGGFSDISDLER